VRTDNNVGFPDSIQFLVTLNGLLAFSLIIAGGGDSNSDTSTKLIVNAGDRIAVRVVLSGGSTQYRCMASVELS